MIPWRNRKCERAAVSGRSNHGGHGRRLSEGPHRGADAAANRHPAVGGSSMHLVGVRAACDSLQVGVCPILVRHPTAIAGGLWRGSTGRG